MRKPVRILGIGTVLTCGTGIGALKTALKGGQPCGHSDISLEGLEEFVPANRSRRLDPLGRMALLSACLSLRDAGLSPGEGDKTSTGIVFGTALGPQASTFSFLEDIISAGDNCASSFAFTNSVHNLPASNLSLALEIRGPLRTVTAFGHTTGAAFLAARNWLLENIVNRVILILGEECSGVMDYVVRRLGSGGEGVKPFSGECTYRSRGGCVAFVLGREGEGYGRLASVEVCLSPEEAAERAARSDMLFCAAAGKVDEFDLYEKLWASAGRVGAYSPVYGSLMTGLGVEVAVAALSLREQTVFGGPDDACLKRAGISGPAGLPLTSVTAAGVSGPGRVTLIQVET